MDRFAIIAMSVVFTTAAVVVGMMNPWLGIAIAAAGVLLFVFIRGFRRKSSPRRHLHEEVRS